MPPPPGEENNTDKNQVVTKIKPMLSAMPEEIFAQIINSMSIESIAELALTSKKMNAIVKNHKCYKDVKETIEKQLEAKIVGLKNFIDLSKFYGTWFDLKAYNKVEFVNKIDALRSSYTNQKHIIDDIGMSEQYQNLLRFFISTQTPSNILCLAATTGMNALIPDLLEFGCNIDEPTSSSLTPLYCAIENKEVTTLTMLIKYGVDVNAADSNGNTPLIHAIKLTKEDDAADVISTLVIHGANLFARNKNNMRALDIAKDRRFATCTQVLVKFHNEHHMKEHDKIISEYEPNSEQGSLEGVNSARYFRKKITSLLQLLNAMNDMPAEYYSDINEIKDRIEGYLSVYIDIWSSEIKYSRIHHAIKKDYERAIKILALKKYISIQKGFHAIHYAAYLNCDDTFEDLIKAGVNINRLTKSKETPLAIAAININYRIINKAIELKAAITFQAMKNAILSSSSGILSILIKTDHNLNIRDENGNTLLMIAIEEKQYQIAVELIEYGIDVNAVNNEDESALTYAMNLNADDTGTIIKNAYLLSTLENAGAKPMNGENHDARQGIMANGHSKYHLFLNRNAAIAALGTGLGIGMALGLAHVSSLGIISLNMGNIAAVYAVASVVVYACITLALYSYHTHRSPEQQASCFAGLTNMLRFRNTGQNEPQTQHSITMRPLNTLS